MCKHLSVICEEVPTSQRDIPRLCCLYKHVDICLPDWISLLRTWVRFSKTVQRTWHIQMLIILDCCKKVSLTFNIKTLKLLLMLG